MQTVGAAPGHPPHQPGCPARYRIRRSWRGTWTHDHLIPYDAAKSLGLPVRSDIGADFFDLMALCPQPVRRQQTVEYLRNIGVLKVFEVIGRVKLPRDLTPPISVRLGVEYFRNQFYERFLGRKCNHPSFPTSYWACQPSKMSPFVAY
jgi:serine dehydrogenase proteinase